MTIDGREVDLWTVEGPPREYHAYWTVPGGERWGLHIVGMTQADQHLHGAIAQVNEAAETRRHFAGTPEQPVRFVRLTLDGPRGARHLQASSAETGPMWPVGSREVDSPGFAMAWWRETDGVGRLDWEAENAGGGIGSRSLWGEGLTLAEAQEIARSLRHAPDVDLSPK